jgi:predicted Zn-dependent peptidase
MEVDNPEYLIHEIFSSNFWKGHALGRPILGTKQTIKTFDRDMIERHYHQWYAPSNILITAAGNLKHKALVQLAEDHFADLKAKKVTVQKRPPTPHAPADFPQQELARTSACVPGCAVDSHVARIALRLLHSQRDSGRRNESRLFQNIREKQGLAYTVFFGTEHVSRRRLHVDLRRHLAQVRRQSGRVDRARVEQFGQFERTT